MAAALLQLAGVHYRVGGRELWTGVDAEITPGVTWVGGDEGVGKTTLLRLLAGVCRPSQGELLVPRGVAPRVAWTDPQDDQMTVRDALALGLQVHAGGDPTALAALVEALDLWPHLDKALYMLSTGSRRKVGLAVTLASGADLLLLDQPFMALDHPSERVVLAWLAEVAGEGRRAALVADYLPPPGVGLSGQIDLDRYRAT